MAFPTTPVLSTFTGVDENPLSEGGNWTGPFRPTANQGRRQANAFANPVSGATTGESYWTPISPLDSEVYATVSALSVTTGEFFGIIARLQNANLSTNQFYAMEFARLAGGTYTVTVFRVISGAFTSIATISSGIAVTAGDKWGLEVSGSGATVTLRAYQNPGGAGWAQVSTDVSDSNASRITSAGPIGLYIGGASTNANRLDDFGGGTIVVGSTTLHELSLSGIGI